MKIEFRKITNKPKPICITLHKANSDILDENESIEVQGEVIRKDNKLVIFQGKMSGYLQLICARSGQDFIYQINESLVLYFSDGIWEAQNQSKDIDSLDVIEFFDGFIDFDFVITSEIESIRLDYNIKE